MFGSLKIAMVAILITGIAGAGMYVMKLRSDNAILKANQVKLESAVADQKQLIENQQKDFQERKVLISDHDNNKEYFAETDKPIMSRINYDENEEIMDMQTLNNTLVDNKMNDLNKELDIDNESSSEQS